MRHPTRRRFLRATVGVSLGSGTLTSISGQTAAQEAETWPQFCYDPANTGYAPANTGPITEISQHWRYETEQDWRVWSSPAVVDGTVYIGSASPPAIHAIRRSDGTKQWVQHVGSSVNQSSPAVAEGTAYIGAGGAAGRVYALNASDGTRQWTFETVDGAMSSPVVENGTVYVGCDDGDSGVVHALKTTDGTQRWSFEINNLVRSSPAVVDGTVYIGSDARFGTVHALDVKTGNQRWEFDADGSVRSSPTVVNGTVYVGCDSDSNTAGGHAYALNATDGTEQWSFETTGSVRTSPAVADGTVYVGSDGGYVYALEAKTGTKQWSYETSGSVRSSPAVVNETVYFGSDDGSVYALDAKTGAKRWSFETGGFVRSSPAVVNKTVYLGSDDGYVYALSGQANTPTATPSATPTATLSATPAKTSPSTPTITPTQTPGGIPVERWKGQEDKLIGILLGLLGLAGIGGAGTWWLSRRRNNRPTTRTAPSKPDAGVASDKPDASGQGKTNALDQDVDRVNDGTDDPSASSADSTAQSGIRGEISDLLERGDTLRERARTYRANRAYERALKTYDEARETYEKAREKADEANLVESVDIDHGLTKVTKGKQKTQQRRLKDEIESLRSDLEQVSALLDDGNRKDAQERLSAMSSSLVSIKESASEHDLADLQPEIATLEEQYDQYRSRIAEQRQSRQIPETIPRAPDLSVDYESLTHEEHIGGGGNADVTKATLSTPDGEVTLAIKRPRMAGTLHTEIVDRLLEEAETWDKLDDHDHIVGVVDYGSEPMPWIAMEYMDGGHLGERAGHMELPQALWTAVAITKGVRHAHRRGIAHLDLKPENILFRTIDDAWDVPKVADWGLSKQLLNHSKSVEGLSPRYAAPEQFDEDYGSADEITDVYQLGAVFYELFTGRPPFDGKPTMVMRAVMDDQPTPPSKIVDVPEKLDAILLTALAKQKSDRYESTLLLRNALQELFDGY